MDTVEYRLGLLLGMAVGIAAGVVILMVLFKKKVLDMHFDERQVQARGRANQCGFFALAVSVWLFSEFGEGFPWLGAKVGAYLCLDLGATVFAVTAVWKDAYLKPREKPGRAAALLALAGAGCLCLSVFRLWREGLLVDGTLNLWVMVAAASLSDLLVLAVFWHRHISGRREEEAE